MGRRTSARRLDVWRTDGLTGALAVLVIVAAAWLSGVSQRLEYRLYDAATTVQTPPPLPEIAIVGIDDASLAALGPWPWSHDVHARMIDRLAAAGAKTIVYTPLLHQSQSDRGLAALAGIKETLARGADGSPLAQEMTRAAAEAEAALSTDLRLAASVRKAGNVLLASRYIADGTDSPLPSSVYRSTTPDPRSYAVEVHAAQHPIPVLADAAAGIGHTYSEPDTDGTVRRAPLFVRYDKVGVAALALLAARHSLHLGASDMRLQAEPAATILGPQTILTDSESAIHPRMHARVEGQPAFPVSSFHSVLSGQKPVAAFKDKMVLVGETTGNLATPLLLPGGSAFPVEWLAQVISAARQGLTVHSPSWGAAAGWVATLLVLACTALFAPRMPRGALLCVGLLLALVIGLFEWVMLRYAGQWIPMLLPVLATVSGTLVMAVRHQGPKPLSRKAAETAEADRMMGLAFHGNGQLDMAFERLRKVPPNEALMDNLYHLAQDFERLKNFAKAKAVYEHILRHDRNFKDARSRYKRLRAKLQSAAAPDSTSGPISVSEGMVRLPGDAVGIPMLGRYQIEKAIGKGAMGVVFLGKDPKIGRTVAIKTLALSQEFEGDALVDARARFFREAETAGRLQHPCIVTIFDAGEEHDLAYIAMEFLRGTDLASACEKGQLLPIPVVLSIIARVADALDYAHAHQVVHRDIKPANIMFDAATDSVKVTDFGIARITDSSKTRTGLVLGTPSFMSPEQLAGKKVDGRTDLYSLGITMFQLLSGALPLRGESMTELMHKIANVEAPDVRQLRPDLPPAVAAIVATALRKRPEARYQTGRQFANDIRQASGARSGQTATPEAGAVVYDADRDVTEQNMADFQTTVMEPPMSRGVSAPPASSAR